MIGFRLIDFGFDRSAVGSDIVTVTRLGRCYG